MAFKHVDLIFPFLMAKSLSIHLSSVQNPSAFLYWFVKNRIPLSTVIPKILGSINPRTTHQAGF